MKKRLLTLCLIASAAFPARHSAGQETPAAISLESPKAPSPDHYSASFRLGFNINATFKNSGSFGPQGHLVPIPGLGSPLQPGNPNGDANGNRTYEDGYIWRDSSGNAFGYSRYWGYDNAEVQYNSSKGTIVMHSSSSSGVKSTGGDDDPTLGFETGYQRDFTTGPDARWGIQAAFNFMNVGIHDSRPLKGSGRRLSDPYQLPPIEGGGFVLPPPAPYMHGPDLSPSGNPVIESSPGSRSFETFSTSISGSHVLDADIFGWHVGPYFVVPFGNRMALEVSGGLAIAAVFSDFSFSETITAPSVQPHIAQSSSQSRIQAGGYVSGKFTLALSERVSLLVGCQFQDVSKYTHTLAGREAGLDLSRSVFVTIGAIFSF